jgi:hypothetical protein
MLLIAEEEIMISQKQINNLKNTLLSTVDLVRKKCVLAELNRFRRVIRRMIDTKLK